MRFRLGPRRSLGRTPIPRFQPITGHSFGSLPKRCILVKLAKKRRQPVLSLACPFLGLKRCFPKKISAFANFASFCSEPSLLPSKIRLRVLDAGRLEQNIARMRDKIRAHGVALRSHVKIAKNIEGTCLALGGDTNRGKITVSALKEAEFFFSAGIRDILYAVGVTEVHAGVFVFFDLMMAGLEVCSIDDIAISVLATVLGHQPGRGWIITDAGFMALSRDRGTARQEIDQGYGKVCDIEGKPHR